ncbi:hypothetical protein GGF32_006901 [Allomyces javanicus]|nr:hypothetical protein GGF32_006901 [Allomyces javanicus]
MPRRRPSESDNTGSDQITTLDAILIGTLVGELVLIFVSIFILSYAQHRATQRAAKLEKQFGLEQGPPKDKDDEVIIPKNQYWYAWLAAKARGRSAAPNLLGDVTIAMPPLPPPAYLMSGVKSAFTMTQPKTWTVSDSVPARGILATGDVDKNGSRVVATARCRPYDASGRHAGFAANSTGAERTFRRVAAHAFADPDAKPCARLEVRFAESMVAPVDTHEIDQALDKVNKVVAAKRPSPVVLRLFSALILTLWIGGIAVFINALVAKSNDQMWVTGALHWPGAQQQLLVGAIMFVGGWLLLIVAIWYETRTPLATRVAVAKLNHSGARFRYHFCMPLVAGRKRSYVRFSPLRVGQAPIMAVTLLCFVAQVVNSMSCSCNCDGDDEENGKDSEGSVWESWAAPLETEWIISVRAAGSAPAPASEHASGAEGYASPTGSVSSQSSEE